MPIHPVYCPKCDRQHEVLTFSIHAEVDLTCPQCGTVGERRFGLPLAKTDSTFFRGAQEGGAPFAHDPLQEKAYTEPARKAGVSIHGKVYQHGLARFQGDPEAYISNLSEARALLRKRGWGSEQLGVKAREVAPKPSVAVAEDLVDAEIDRRIAAGTMEERDRNNLDKRFTVGDTLTAHYKKGTYKPKIKKKKLARK